MSAANPRSYMRPGDEPDLTDEIGIICDMAAFDFDLLKRERPSWAAALACWSDPENEVFGNEAFSIESLSAERAGEIYLAEWDRLLGAAPLRAFIRSFFGLELA